MHRLARHLDAPPALFGSRSPNRNEPAGCNGDYPELNDVGNGLLRGENNHRGCWRALEHEIISGGLIRRLASAIDLPAADRPLRGINGSSEGCTGQAGTWNTYDSLLAGVMQLLGHPWLIRRLGWRLKVAAMCSTYGHSSKGIGGASSSRLRRLGDKRRS